MKHKKKGITFDGSDSDQSGDDISRREAMHKKRRIRPDIDLSLNEEDGVEIKKTEQQINQDEKNEVEDEELMALMPKGYEIMKKMGYRPPKPEIPLDHKRNHEEFKRWISNNYSEKSLENQWKVLQKIAFEITGDVENYKPGVDPRDFNVLWRNYITALNKACLKSRSKNTDTDKTSDTVGGHSINTKTEEKRSECLEDVQLTEKDTKILEKEVNEEPIIQEDMELDMINDMPLQERIMKLNIFLRSEVYYCFYCGIKYKDEGDLYEHCPGIKQDDHE